MTKIEKLFICIMAIIMIVGYAVMPNSLEENLTKLRQHEISLHYQMFPNCAEVFD